MPLNLPCSFDMKLSELEFYSKMRHFFWKTVFLLSFRLRLLRVYRCSFSTVRQMCLHVSKWCRSLETKNTEMLCFRLTWSANLGLEILERHQRSKHFYSAQEHGFPAVRSTSHNISNWSQFWKKLAVLNSLCGRLIRVPKSSIPSAWLEPRDAHLYEAFLCIPEQALYCKDHQPNEEGQNPTCRTWWLNQPPLKKYAKVKMDQNLPQFSGWKLRTYLKSPTSKRMGCKTWS